MGRVAKVERATSETDIRLELDLDGTGRSRPGLSLARIGPDDVTSGAQNFDLQTVFGNRGKPKVDDRAAGRILPGPVIASVATGAEGVGPVGISRFEQMDLGISGRRVPLP